MQMELCKGRHSTPATDGAIFETEINPLDVNLLETIAEGKLKGLSELTLYVTGLSVALVAVINACHKGNVKLTLMHYNKETEKYYPQEVK